MKRILPRALCQLVYITAVLAVLDVLAAQSRRLGAQHGAEPALLTPLELLLLAAAHAAVPDLPAFVVLFLVLFLVLSLVLSLVLFLFLVLLFLVVLVVVPVAVMATVLLLLPVAVGELLSIVGLLAVVLLLLLLPDLFVAVLLRQELRLHLVAAEAVALAPLGSGEM